MRSDRVVLPSIPLRQDSSFQQCVKDLPVENLIAEILSQYLRRNFPGATYHCAYEAGFSGFWTREALTAQDIDCIVVNPADVATTNKERQCKTDRIDAQKLARELANGALRAIYVPDRRAQEDRSLVRLRASFVRKQTRAKNQIKALLEYYGITPRGHAGSAERHCSGKYIQWLQEVPFCNPSGKAAMDTLLSELLSLRESIARLTRQIRLLAGQDLYRHRIELLQSVPGVSLLIAMSLLTELVTMDRFDSLDSLASFFGLVPGEPPAETDRS